MINFLKTNWQILLIALVLRVILSSITYHSDIQALNYGGNVIASGHVLDLYDYLYKVSDSDPILKVFPKTLFNYPPSIYFVYALNSLTFLNLTPIEIKNGFIFDIQNTLGNPLANLHILLLKLPLFLFDFGTAYLLVKILKERKQKYWGLRIWLFNPITLYGVYMVGQFDIIPTFLTILSIYLCTKNESPSRKNLFLSAAILGLGGAFKIYPLFLLIPLISTTEKWLDRILAVLLGVAVYISLILPFITSVGYRMNALVANQTLKSLYPQIAVSGGESIMLFVASLLFVYLVFVVNKASSTTTLWWKYFLVLLIFFIFTHFHPQWLVWLSPFLVVDLVEQNFKTWPVVILLLLSFVGMILFFDPGLSIGLFSAVNPVLYNSDSLWKIVGLNLDYNFYRSVLQSVFVGCSIFYFYQYFSYKKE